MAKKPTVTTITSGYASNTQLNANFVALRDGFDNTLSLDGSTPNSMGADLDMNGNDILNGGTMVVADLTVAGLDVNTALNSAVAASAASAVDSAASAVDSAVSASSAALYDGPCLDDVTALLADTTLTLTPGQPNTVVVGDYVRTRKEGFSYEVVASSGDVVTAGGIQLDVTDTANGTRLPEQYGAVGDGVTDDQAAMDKWLIAGGGDLSAKTYAISGTLKPGNRGRIVGKKQYWSSLSQSRITRIGASTAVVVQVSAATLGTTATSARSAVFLKDFSIDGAGVAEVGLFMNYVTNESRVENITAINCEVGILGAQMWYASLRDLTARSCTVMGISLGAQYKSTFDVPQINGVRMDNLRAANCGSRYNVTTNPYGFGASNYEGGCGILISTGQACYISQLTGENCYGPGVVLATTTSDVVGGIYCEGNAAGAVTDGEITNPYGMLLVSRTSGRTARVDGIYLTDSNSYIHVDDTADGAYRFPFLGSQGSNPYVISTESGDGDQIEVEGNYNVTGIIPSTSYEASRFAAYTKDKDLTGTANSGEQSVETFTPYKQKGWASGTTLTLADIRMKPNGQARGTGATFLMSVHVHAYSGGSNDSYVSSYIINVNAAQRDATMTAAEVTVTITELGTGARENSTTLLGAITPVASVSVTSGVANVLIKASPTSTGSTSSNSISCSGVMLGTSANNGWHPTFS